MLTLLIMTSLWCLVSHSSEFRTLAISLFHACPIVGFKPEFLLCLEAARCLVALEEFYWIQGKCFLTSTLPPLPKDVRTPLWADLTCLRLLSWSVRCILGVFVLS